MKESEIKIRPERGKVHRVEMKEQARYEEKGEKGEVGHPIGEWSHLAWSLPQCLSVTPLPVSDYFIFYFCLQSVRICVCD